MEYQIITRAEAKEQGLKFFFTGKPCRRGHLALRRLNGDCTECQKLLRKKFNTNNPNYQKEYEKTYKEIRRAKHLTNKYNLTLEEYDRMLEEQGYSCYICKTKPEDKPLFVDHCHKTNQVRHLLCHNCNAALGHAKDSPDILKAMIVYLTEN